MRPTSPGSRSNSERRGSQKGWDADIPFPRPIATLGISLLPNLTLRQSLWIVQRNCIQIWNADENTNRCYDFVIATLGRPLLALTIRFGRIPLWLGV